MPDRKKKRVLHVTNGDDHLLTALTSDGHELTEADGTSQALNHTAFEQFDYIVVERASPTESILRESEKRFRATFEQAAVGVAHSSLNGRLLLMNQKLCDIVGYTPEEIGTKTYQEVTHPEDLKAELEYARRLLAGEIESCSYEKRYIRKDGALIWVTLTASVVRDEKTREPSYFVAIIQDISARKAAEEALRESEEFNRRIVESSSDCIKILDLEGRLLYISERGQELLGIKDAVPYINTPWIELWPSEGQQSARTAIEQAKTTGLGVFQAYGPTPDGEGKWWETVITPMSDAAGKVARLLAISRDMIERAVITTTGSVLQISAITDTSTITAPHKLSKTLEEVEREYITAVYEATGWKIEGPEGAAKILGLPPNTLRTRMRKLGLSMAGLIHTTVAVKRQRFPRLKALASAFEIERSYP